MTPQERQLIESLAGKLRNAPAPQVDAEADALIRSAIGSQPNALYVLTQTVLMQEMALEQLRGKPAGSFLGTPPAAEAAPPVPGQPSWWGNSSPSTPATRPATYNAPAPAPMVAQPAGSGFSGFMRTAATTAAGVIAGEMAFSALSGLFGHSSSGFGSSYAPSFTPAPSITNNYYGEQTGTPDRVFTDADAPAHHAADNYATADHSVTDDTASYEEASYDDGGSYDDAGSDSGDM